jgi:hypothetical protein
LHDVSTGDSNYTVGRGKPPLHTRFQKGQSGNPSGKPGPAKLARQRFQRALHTALEAETAELKDARPRVNLDVIARRLTLAAAGGDRGAMKLILSELDREIAREEPGPAGWSMTEETEEESGEQGADEPPPMMDYALWRKAHPDE